MVALIKPSGQQYIFLADDDPGMMSALHKQLGQFASDPQLDFSWQDACYVRLKMQQVLESGS